MKFASLLIAVLTSTSLFAQEVAPLDKARDLAYQLGRLYGELKGAPFASVPDLDQPQALSAGDVAMVVIPERGLSDEKLKAVGDELVPVGVLWTRSVLPTMGSFGAVDEKGAPAITVRDKDGKQVVLHAFHMGVRMGDAGRPELELYGNGKEPVTKGRLLPLPSKHEVPIELAVFGDGDESAILTLSLAGRFQGEVRIRKHEATPSRKVIELALGEDADKAVKAGQVVMPHLNDFPAAPVKVVGVPRQAVLFEQNDVAALVVPHARIDTKALEQGREVAIGQLWLKGIVPDVGGRAAAGKDLRLVRIEADDKQFTLPQFLLTARKSDENGAELLVYSGRKKALLSTPLQPVKLHQSRPVELDGRQRDDSSGILTIAVLGSYAAEIIMRPAAE